MLLRLLIQQLTDGQVPVVLLVSFPKKLYVVASLSSPRANVILNETSDNIFTLQQWCSTTFPQAKEQLEHMYREVCSVLLFHLCFCCLNIFSDLQLIKKPQYNVMLFTNDCPTHWCL